VQDFVWGGIKFSMSSANNLLMADPTGTGTGQIQALAAGASPMFPSPVATTDSPFAVVDATIRFGGVDLVELTSFDLTMNINPTAPATFGSGGQKKPPASKGAAKNLIAPPRTTYTSSQSHPADFDMEPTLNTVLSL
jgi:hypothetical protein